MSRTVRQANDRAKRASQHGKFRTDQYEVPFQVLSSCTRGCETATLQSHQVNPRRSSQPALRRASSKMSRRRAYLFGRARGSLPLAAGLLDAWAADAAVGLRAAAAVLQCRAVRTRAATGGGAVSKRPAVTRGPPAAAPALIRAMLPVREATPRAPGAVLWTCQVRSISLAKLQPDPGRMPAGGASSWHHKRTYP